MLSMGLIKIISSFVKFVEDLSLIIADLETLGLCQEVSNPMVLLKIEEKLTKNVAREWTKEVIQNKLDLLPPGSKFDAMLVFLETQKRCACYSSQHSQVAGSGGVQYTVSEIKTVQTSVGGSPKSQFKGNASPRGAGGSTPPCLACGSTGTPPTAPLSAWCGKPCPGENE